jgi:hypothetical protein
LSPFGKKEKAYRPIENTLLIDVMCADTLGLRRTKLEGTFMLCSRCFISVIALLFTVIVTSPTPAPAQTPLATEPAQKVKLTRQKLSEMGAKWKANKPKLKACRAEVRKRGLAGDDRWFFIEDCMDKS